VPVYRVPSSPSNRFLADGWKRAAAGEMLLALLGRDVIAYA
jgi:hypothetical protein